MKKDEFDKLTIKQKLDLYYQFLDREQAGEEDVWDTDEAKWARAFMNGLAVRYFSESAGAAPKREALTETLFTVLELTEGDDGYHHARLLLTHGDTLNKNHRVYPMSIWAREVPRVKPAVLEGSFVGMANHPGFFRGEDILATVIKFTDLWVDGKDVYGDVIVIPTTAGKDVIELAKAKVKIGVSSRGYGTAERRDWTDPQTGQMHKDVQVIQDDYELAAFDLVSRPSVKDASVVHFEHVGESGMMTVKKLGACWPELMADVKGLAVTEALQEVLQELGFPSFKAVKDKIEVQGQAIGRLHEEKHELELDRGSLLETRGAILDMFDILPEPDPLVNCKQPINEARQQLLDEKQALTERLGARDHLIEKVKGEKAAWLILVELWDAESTTEVDAQYESAKDKADLMLARGATPSGKGDTFVEGDDAEDIPEAKRKQRILRACGMAP